MEEKRTPRIPFIDAKEQLPPEQRGYYERIAESRGDIVGPFGVLLNSPVVADRIGHLGAYIRFESTLSGTDRELTILTTAREWDCAFEWAAHEPLARDAGVSDEAIDAVATRAPAENATEMESLIIRYVRELLRDRGISETTFRAATDRFDDQGITELTATIGYYGMLACVLNAFEVRPGEDEHELP